MRTKQRKFTEFSMEKLFMPAGPEDILNFSRNFLINFFHSPLVYEKQFLLLVSLRASHESI